MIIAGISSKINTVMDTMIKPPAENDGSTKEYIPTPNAVAARTHGE